MVLILGEYSSSISSEEDSFLITTLFYFYIYEGVDIKLP